MVFDSVEKLNKIALEKATPALSFNLEIGELKFKGVYFSQTCTFLIGELGYTIAWQFSVRNGYSVTPFIPTDVFSAIREKVFHAVNDKKTTPLFERLNSLIKALPEESFLVETKSSITSLLKTAVTGDRNYDIDGDKPFFIGWRRNPKGDFPNPLNLNKTERLFGFEIRELCYKNKISSRWSINANDQSFDFLNCTNVKREIIHGKEI
jgi:hypothetical protein